MVSNAAKVFSRNGYIGYSSSSLTNLVFVTDAGSIWSNPASLYVGYDGAVNQLVVSNAGQVVSTYVYLGYDSSSTNNSVTVAGGTLIVTNSSFGVGPGTIDIRRGTVTLNSGLLKTDLLQANSGASGKFSFNGGTVQALGANFNNGLPVVVGDGTSPASYQLTLPGGFHTFRNGLTVSSNASLTGYGTIQANLTVAAGGSLSAGATNAIAGITVTKGITLSERSTTLIKLNAASSSTDHFDGATNVAFGGTLQLTNMSGSLGNGQAFKLFNAAGFTGAFAALSPASPGFGLRWNTNQLNVDGTLRVFSVPTPAPIITSASFSSSGMAISSQGIPYDPCYLLTATNLASPLAEWIPCETNRFDSAGNVSITHAAALDEPQRFYRLSVE
jgi:T5SS/PEP-CTERM-associated repeat protein